MSTFYYDFNAAVNGTGTSASPFNGTGWTATTVSAGNSYMFKRGNTLRSAFTTVKGTNATTLVSYGAWANADGSDDETLPRPIIITSVALSTFGSTNKDYVSIQNWDIRAWALPIASDTNAICMGTGATINNCIIMCNCGCIGSYGKSNVTITNNTCYGVAHAASTNNNVIVVSDVSASSVAIENNIVYHLGGGSTNSHGIRAECSDTFGALTGLTVRNNTVSAIHYDQRIHPWFGYVAENRGDPALHLCPGMGFIDDRSFPYPTPVVQPKLCNNTSALGMRLTRCPSALIENNRVFGFLEGIFLTGGGAATAATINHNICNYNRHYGIHLTTDAIGCTIKYNTCNYNGTNIYDGVILFAYGRGIECSSAAGQGRCHSHTIAFNFCQFNKNYGGPNDNSTEGVGIGLDDGTSNCYLYGNTLTDNEGNGVQYYGASGTDTHNNVAANFFSNNCTASFTNRRSGGTFTNRFCADIACASTLGAQSYIVNNVFVGTTPVCISLDSTDNTILIANNIFYNKTQAIMVGTSTMPTGSGATRNDFFNVTKKYVTNAVDANGQCTFVASAYTGISDYTFDPLLDAAYKPSTLSPAINAGITTAPFSDFTGHLFDTPPTLGMRELFADVFRYYVSTTGNDSNAGTTTATAFLTISKGASVAAPGDTIYVLSGNYQGSIYLDWTYPSGTSAEPILLKSITNRAAAIRALAAPAAGGNNFAALEIRPDNWIVDGFEITGEDGYTNTADTSWNYSISTEWCIGVYANGTNIVTRNCYIHDLARGTVAAAHGGAAIKGGPEFGGNSQKACFNTIYRIGSTGTGNTVHGIRMDASACTVNGNLIGNVFNGAGVRLSGAATSAVVANNTIFTARAGIEWGQSGIFAIYPWLCSSRAFNNIIQDCSIGVLDSGNIGSGNIANTNVTWNCTTPYSFVSSTATNKLSFTPTFVSYVSTGNGDYHLSAGSGAIGVGVSSLSGVAAPVSDIDGNTRPISGTFDLGAYEFSANTVTVPTATQLRTQHRKSIFHNH